MGYLWHSRRSRRTVPPRLGTTAVPSFKARHFSKAALDKGLQKRMFGMSLGSLPQLSRSSALPPFIRLRAKLASHAALLCCALSADTRFRRMWALAGVTSVSYALAASSKGPGAATE